MNGVKVFLLVTQQDKTLSIFRCRAKRFLNCRLEIEVHLDNNQIIQYVALRPKTLSYPPALIIITDQQIATADANFVSELKWSLLGKDLGLNSCTSTDLSNIFCLSSKDNCVKKIMLSNSLKVSIVNIPEIELANAIYSSIAFKDLLFIKTIGYVKIFNFKLKKIKFEISNEIVRKDNDFSIKISDKYLVFISKSLSQFLMYDLIEFYQGNVPEVKFHNMVTFPKNLKLSNYTKNIYFDGSKMALILHDSKMNYLVVYDLSKPFMDILFCIESIFSRNKLEYIRYQIHSIDDNNFHYYITVANPSYDKKPLSLYYINFELKFSSILYTFKDEYDATIRYQSATDPSLYKDYSFKINRVFDTVTIEQKPQTLSKAEQVTRKTMNDYFSPNIIDSRLFVHKNQDLNDFLNKHILTSSILHKKSFLQNLNHKDFGIESQLYIESVSILVVLMNDRLLYFRHKDNIFSLMNIISLLDFFGSENIECSHILKDKDDDLYILCNDSQSYYMLNFSLSNIFLPIQNLRLFNSNKNKISDFRDLNGDKFGIFYYDSGLNNNFWKNYKKGSRSFFKVYDITTKTISPKFNLQKAYINLISIIYLKGNFLISRNILFLV